MITGLIKARGGRLGLAPFIKGDEPLGRGLKSSTEHEEGGGDEAEPCPEEVQAQLLAHVKDRKCGEHTHRDYFLHDFELTEAVPGLNAEAVAWDLQTE